MDFNIPEPLSIIKPGRLIFAPGGAVFKEMAKQMALIAGVVSGNWVVNPVQLVSGPEHDLFNRGKGLE